MSSSSYEKAFEKAGATIHAFEAFGSYQGEWWAKITTKEGKTGWITGYYGSCSGCDAYEIEFGSFSHTTEDDDYHSEYDTEFPYPGCKRCGEYEERVAEFGRSYFDEIMTQEEAEKKAAAAADWDMEAQFMIDFIRKNK